jgi:hypothetical protein
MGRRDVHPARATQGAAPAPEDRSPLPR